MKSSLTLALLAALACTASAAAPRGWKPSLVLCPVPKACYCLQVWGTTGATVDCATCTCTACPQPTVVSDSWERWSKCRSPSPTYPSYYLTASKTCEKCKAVNCDMSGCAPDGTCRTCKAGTGKNLTLADKPCVEGTVANCAVISPADVTKCAKCATGYWLSSGACLPCTAANCLECSSRTSNTCKRCLPGYGLVKDATTGATVCSQCDAANVGCATCNGDLTKCQKCLDTDPAGTTFWALDPATSQCMSFPL